jgi:hypothetical protein
MVDENKVGAARHEVVQLVAFAEAEVGGGVQTGALLGERGDNLESQRLRELAQFGR